MINNNGMYFNYNNPFYNYSSYPGGCSCMQGGFQMRGSNYTNSGFQVPYNCPYIASSYQYSPGVPSFNSAEEGAFANNENFTGYMNQPGLYMRTVSIEDIID